MPVECVGPMCSPLGEPGTEGGAGDGGPPQSGALEDAWGGGAGLLVCRGERGAESGPVVDERRGRRAEVAQAVAVLAPAPVAQVVRADLGLRGGPAGVEEGIQGREGGNRGAGLGILDGAAGDGCCLGEVALGQPDGLAKSGHVHGEVGVGQARGAKGAGTGHGQHLLARAGAHGGFDEDGNQAAPAAGGGQGGRTDSPAAAKQGEDVADRCPLAKQKGPEREEGDQQDQGVRRPQAPAGRSIGGRRVRGRKLVHESMTPS